VEVVVYVHALIREFGGCSFCSMFVCSYVMRLCKVFVCFSFVYVMRYRRLCLFGQCLYGGAVGFVLLILSSSCLYFMPSEGDKS